MFAGFFKFVGTDNIFTVLVFVGVEQMPQINVCLIQVVHLADDIDLNANFFCNAGEIPGIGKAAYKVNVRFLEVSRHPIRERAIVLFHVGVERRLRVHVFVMQGPCAGQVLFAIVNCYLLTFGVQYKHTLPTAQTWWCFCVAHVLPSYLLSFLSCVLALTLTLQRT